jgi:nicotinate-nucleotide adenylyltransferase
VNEIEQQLPPPSYTANMLDALAARHPGNEWFFLLGGDALAEMPTWFEPTRIVARASLVVMARPGHPIPSKEQVRQSLGMPSDGRLELQVVDVPLIDLSSRDIRARVAAGRSIRFMTPRAVEDHIRGTGLYR